MQLEVLRFSSGPNDTLGVFHDTTTLARKFLSFTLEDEPREKKVKGETRIPAGTYPIALRTEGTHHARALARYGPDFHKGMLWIRDVPGFEWILIHVGNTDADTEGCLLVGDGVTSNVPKGGALQSSEQAYKRIYPPIAARFVRGDPVTITFRDYA